MTEKQLKIPYDPELIAELNTERYQLTKEGKIRLTHPEGTHGDRFWKILQAPKVHHFGTFSNAKTCANSTRPKSTWTDTWTVTWTLSVLATYFYVDTFS